jgi:hypothetical protein
MRFELSERRTVNTEQVMRPDTNKFTRPLLIFNEPLTVLMIKP